MSELAIEVSDLHKSYGQVEAVRGISFGVERGEVFGLLGPNGAGKTTTVEILEGYRGRSAGEVRVLGHDPELRDRELSQRIGIVLQQGGFYPRLTVREAVGHMAKAYPRPRDVGETIDLVGLGEKAETRARQLSGGQQRRLDLALALVGDPELIFLDEPTTGFDPAARRTAWTVVEALKDLGKTILLTTHYLEEAEALAHRVAIMRDGRIAVAGSLGEVSAQLPARISFRAPAVTLPAALEALRVRDGRVGEHVLETADLQADLGRLLAWADTHDLALERLHARGGSLEDAFMGVLA